MGVGWFVLEKMILLCKVDDIFLGGLKGVCLNVCGCD